MKALLNREKFDGLTERRYDGFGRGVNGRVTRLEVVLIDGVFLEKSIKNIV
jgi:hypothetical protein